MNRLLLFILLVSTTFATYADTKEDYVLIIVYETRKTGGVVTQEFLSKESCEFALSRIKSPKMNMLNNMHAECVPK